MRKKLRYGILSTASIVPRFVQALRLSGTGEAVAIASRSIEKARAKAAEWEIPKSYGSYEELLGDPEVDVVYVAMINSGHYANALLALEQGKHVICEKPFVLEKAQAEHLFAVAAEKKLFLAEAQKAVFLPVMEEIKRRLEEGVLGKVHLVDMTSSCSGVYNDWLHSQTAGGGALYGSASYTIHLMRFLFGCEIADYAGICTKGASRVDEQCVVNLRMANEVLVVSKISTNVLADNKAVIYGEAGRIEIPDYWKARKAFFYNEKEEMTEISYPCDYELIYELRHFDECMRKGLLQSPVMSKEMTVSTLALMQNLRDGWACLFARETI